MEKVGSSLRLMEFAMDYELWLRFSEFSPATIIPHYYRKF